MAASLLMRQMRILTELLAEYQKQGDKDMIRIVSTTIAELTRCATKRSEINKRKKKLENGVLVPDNEAKTVDYGLTGRPEEDSNVKNT